MLTRKPSAAAPAAYPTGKEGRGPRAALSPPGHPRGADGAPSPRFCSSLHAGREASPSGALRACRAGTAPGLLPPGLGWAVALCSPVLFPACNVGLRAPAQRGSPAGSRTLAWALLNFAAARAPPVGARWGSPSQAPRRPPGRRFLESGICRRESGVCCPEGRGGATGPG